MLCVSLSASEEQWISPTHSLAPMGRKLNENSELTRSEEQIIMKDFSMNNETVSTDTVS